MNQRARPVKISSLRARSRRVDPMRRRIATLTIASLLSLSGVISADVVDGKVARNDIDLFYKIVGPTSGDYVLVLSGGPGEDIHSMQGIADELGKKYRCIM